MDGPKIAELRRKRGWGQQDLAVRAGLNAMTVSRAERGLGISLDSATAIADALGVTVDELRDKRTADHKEIAKTA